MKDELDERLHLVLAGTLRSVMGYGRHFFELIKLGETAD